MLLIIGLDGATWDVAEPLIAAGRMPNLAALRARGVWGSLASTIPPATFPSWATFATGVNPGRHGIFDFTRRVFGTYEVTFVNSTFRARQSAWKYLSEAGKRVAVLGVPGTYPPEPLNGCMISGFDTPVTTRADASFVAPSDFVPLVEAEGGFPFAEFQEFRIDPDWYPMAFGRMQDAIDTKVRLARRLLRHADWDCFFLLFGESDTVAHHYWRFHDPASPRFEPAAAGLHDAVNAVYERLDRAIGELMEAAGGDDVMVVSDHGFGGASLKCVYLNRWLAEAGLQKRTSTPGGAIGARIKEFALAHVPAGMQALAFRMNGGRWASRLESRARFAGISWRGTTAFSEELNYFPSVWLNLKGREPEGTVDPRDYGRALLDVCGALRELRDPETGAAIVANAWPREEVYQGPYSKYAPDIVLQLNLDGRYSYNCLPSSGAAGDGAFHVLDRLQVDRGKLTGMSGSHRADGLFVLCGPGDWAGEGKQLVGVNIADMAPTLLALTGVDVPADLDGRVLRGEGVVSARTGGAEQEPPGEPYSAEEAREVAERLAALGYLG